MKRSRKDWRQEFDHEPMVLVVDDDAELADLIAGLVRSAGVDARTEHDPQSALAYLRSAPVDVVFCDISMPVMTGTELLRRAQAMGLEASFVFLTGHGDPDTIVDAVRLGALDFLLKPCGSEELFGVLDRALGVAARVQRVKAVLSELGTVAPQTQELIEDLRRQCALLRAHAVRKVV